MKVKDLLKLKILMFAVLALIFTACDDDDPDPVIPQELITTVNVTFTNTADAADIVTATFRDLDGEGGNDPVITNPAALSANSTYTVTIQFLNEQETPAENVNEEIERLNLEHQVFYIAASGLNLTYAYNDQDDNQNPLGLNGTATTGAASSGILTITLLHEPNKTASGVSEGDPANAGGEVDVEVMFNVTIQ